MTDSRQGAGGGAARALGAKGPDELREQIERTRSRLGDTVEELAAKADVKGRTRARAADLRDRAGAMGVQLRSGAAQAGHRAEERAARALRHTRHSASGPVSDAARACRRHPRPLLLVGAAGVAVLTAGLLRRRRRAHIC
ncbi:DUF3618 domain-containing protein [Streptomyces sp. NPDC056160]|uniref:DUF3618 domain-containing protein n=1 Tax=Streptomyces sp. NPDC056160 TaxID=3345731 RepID=UPI0035D771AD